MSKETVFTSLNERGFYQYASIESEAVTEYRFSDGENIIKVFQDNANGICNLEC